MTMAPRLRKFALTAHVTSSVGWLGAVAGFLALAVAGLTSTDAQTVRAAYLAMELTARFVIVPLCLASLLTGLVQSLGTHWGLFRHYWVLVKFLVTMVAAIVLLLQLEPIGYIAGAAAERTLSSSDLREARISLVAHAGGGLLVLLVPTVLSVYKPRGMTRYGRRKQHEQRRKQREQRTGAGAMDAATPAWRRLSEPNRSSRATPPVPVGARASVGPALALAYDASQDERKAFAPEPIRDTATQQGLGFLEHVQAQAPREARLPPLAGTAPHRGPVPRQTRHPCAIAAAVQRLDFERFRVSRQPHSPAPRRTVGEAGAVKTSHSGTACKPGDRDPETRPRSW